MAEWNGLGRYPEDADVNDRPEEGTLLAYVDGSYQDALKNTVSAVFLFFPMDASIQNTVMVTIRTL